MNISNQIIEVIDALCDKFGIAMDWTAENLVPYVETLGEKIIKYEIWTSVFWLVSSLFGFVLSLIIYRFFRKNDPDIENESTFLSIILFGVFAVLTPIIVGIQIHDIIAVSVFPEKTIYDVISNLLQ